MLLGVLGTIAWLRLHPMNLICIMTAQGNGIGIHCFGFSSKPYSLSCTKLYDNENHNSFIQHHQLFRNGQYRQFVAGYWRIALHQFFPVIP